MICHIAILYTYRINKMTLYMYSAVIFCGASELGAYIAWVDSGAIDRRTYRSLYYLRRRSDLRIYHALVSNTR